MDGTRITLERVDETRLPDVETILERNGLPSADVRDGPACFYVATDGGERIGVGGLETDGPDGLLRSLVVERSVRGRGYGTALCDAIESRAREEGVQRLYLLTTTAAGFFRERGYADLERADAPAAIRETAAFATFCPDSAVCLRKSL